MENNINREWFKNIWKNDNNDCEDFETYFANYENRGFYEFKRFYEYCNVNKEFI